MRTTDVIVIGAGQAGLAMSSRLRQLGIDHVVFERGAIAQRWRSTTWDSLRLLTPNWLNQLPRLPYSGADPDGFMARDEFIATLLGYAARVEAPVMAQTAVRSVERDGGVFRVETDRGNWQARAVVVSTGHCDLPLMPAMARQIDRSVSSIHSSQYRSPSSLDAGAVLVVGASSSGVQIADELRRSGRDVFLAVGRHIRLPRTWRDRDIFWWFHRMGILDQRRSDLADPSASMRQPSLQLVGRPDRSNVDLAALQAIGVRLTGRLVSASGDTLDLLPDLAASVAAAEARLLRLLAQIDAFAGIGPDAPRPSFAPVGTDAGNFGRISLRAENIRTILWATGYRRSFSWLPAEALTAEGEIAHQDGVTSIPGLYALGFRFLRKRDSSFIGGVGADALALGSHLAGYLGHCGRRAA